MGGYDAHTHLDFPGLSADAPDRARALGIDGWCIAAADPCHWSRVVQTAERTGAHLALGVHPWFADANIHRIEPLLAECIANSPLDALGELGLDRGYPGLDSTQPAVARAQLALARDRDLPVVLHCVGAHGALLTLLKADGLPSRGGLLHGFIGAPELARRYTELGLHISFGPRSLRSPRTLAAFQDTDPSLRLLETDAPDGAPEPAALLGLAEQLTAHIAPSTAALLAQTGANARTLFPRVLR